MSDDFYIGYLEKAPRSIGKWISWVSLLLIAVTATVGVLLVRNQDPFYPSTFEYGVIRSYVGIYLARPVPSIIVRAEDNPDQQTTFLLVNEGKFGFSSMDLTESNTLESGVMIRLDGTLIQLDDVRMLEVVEGSLNVESTASSVPSATTPQTIYIGARRVTGEIVDSKCFLGVMNPGDKTVHRACARLCIRGGIPPMIHLDSVVEGAKYLLITGENGDSINERVLPYVASPLEITGELFRTGDLYELRVPPGSITLLMD